MVALQVVAAALGASLVAWTGAGATRTVVLPRRIPVPLIEAPYAPWSSDRSAAWDRPRRRDRSRRW